MLYYAYKISTLIHYQLWIYIYEYNETCTMIYPRDRIRFDMIIKAISHSHFPLISIFMLQRIYRLFSLAMQIYTPNTSLSHWGRVTHVCVDNLTINGSGNGLSPGRHPTIIWTNVGILLIGPLGTNFSGILIEIRTFSFKKMYLKCRLDNVGHFVSASIC